MNILQRISDIEELPGLPEVVYRVQSLVNSEFGDASSLARIVERDPALAGNILKIANSSFFGTVHNRISSVSMAIARIGFNEVGSIVMAMSLIRRFPDRSNILNHHHFWQHSLTAAHLCQIVGDAGGWASKPNEKQNLFLAGLLHDIGILICDQFFHSEFENIIAHALKFEASFFFAEQQIMPRESHPMIGGAVMELWKMDPSVISGVRFHHLPAKAPENHRRTASVVYLAEHILCNNVLGSFEGTLPDLDESVWEYLKLSPDVHDVLHKRAEEEALKSQSFFPAESGSDPSRLRMV